MQDYLKSINLDLSDAVVAARQLLGYELICKSSKGTTSGYIVETEAYQADDPASHSFRGLTIRNNSLFEPGSTIYVYFTYGLHYCVNIVTGEKNHGQAVLIRAIEPKSGLNLMEKRRNSNKRQSLTSGPAKLTQAMGIGRPFDGTNILDGPIYIKKGILPKEIVVDKRVGIKLATDQPWRFYIKDNPFVSKLASSTPRRMP